MHRTRIIFYITFILFLIAAILLITGSPLLTKSLIRLKFIPLGTLITWIGMVSLPLSAYWGINQMRSPSTLIHLILSWCLKLIVGVSILWAPLSYFLAGNFSFTFSQCETFQGGQLAMRLFWYLSYGIVISTLTIVSFYWIQLIYKVLKNKWK